MKPQLIVMLSATMLTTTELLAGSNCMFFQNSSYLDPMLYKNAPPELAALIQDKIGTSYFLPADLRAVSALRFTHDQETDCFWRTQPRVLYAYESGKKAAFCAQYIPSDGLWYYTIGSDSKTGKTTIKSMHVSKIMDQKYHSSDVLAAIDKKFLGLKRDGIYLTGKFRFADKFFDLYVTTIGTADGYWYVQANYPQSLCREIVDRELNSTIVEYNFTNSTEEVRWFSDCKKQYEELRAKGKTLDID